MIKFVFFKLYSLLLCLALTLTLFISCSQKKYDDSVECSYITTVLQSDVLNGEKYSLYSAEDISFMLDTDNFDSYSVLFSTSGDDIGEVGVFHAISNDESTELLDDVVDYLTRMKEEKEAFVRNYLPEELQKLEQAKVKRFGNYVVFTVLSEAQSDAAFKKIEQILK